MDHEHNEDASIRRLMISAFLSFCCSGPNPLAYRRAVVASLTMSGQEAKVTQTAHGSFEVKLTPEKSHDQAIARMSIDKEFQGDLQGTSKGEMLGVMGTAGGSGGYVAMERVNGNLGGRSGTFALQHSGINMRGESRMTVTVVPDSGTAQLAGIEGTMNIKVEDGKHLYSFEYSLSKPR